MGRIIDLKNWEGDELPDALRRTGGGGFLSTGYLADEPAVALVEDDETIQYVLTNRKRGVKVQGTDERSHSKPDSDHRTVVVVTDRRLLVLVGRDDGDDRTCIDLATVVGVEATAGRRSGELVVDRADGTTWAIPTGTDSLDAVAAYLREAAGAWRAVEESRRPRQGGRGDGGPAVPGRQLRGRSRGLRAGLRGVQLGADRGGAPARRPRGGSSGTGPRRPAGR
ncbi:hypothetical protein [Haloarcula laminariae]|uniref:hypothetical protein n=1 Tax=Haloarcula laminariae TaxID=2961577 RepID=UPI002405A487|nr:hypothetical protein [Halomicroarcula sp. FL173]